MDEILLTFDGGALKKAGKGFGKGYGSYNIRINGEDKPRFQNNVLPIAEKQKRLNGNW